MAELWTCPRCGARLVHRNLAHSCGPYSVEAFLAGKPERAVGLFHRFERMVAACGPYQVAPAKTRVAFMAEVRFASVNRAGEAGLDVHFVLPEALASARFTKLERIGKVVVHHLRLASRADLDDELQGWLRRSYREYGRREWLRRPRARRRPSPS